MTNLWSLLNLFWPITKSKKEKLRSCDYSIKQCDIVESIFADHNFIFHLIWLWKLYFCIQWNYKNIYSVNASFHVSQFGMRINYMNFDIFFNRCMHLIEHLIWFLYSIHLGKGASWLKMSSFEFLLLFSNEPNNWPIIQNNKFSAFFYNTLSWKILV